MFRIRIFSSFETSEKCKQIFETTFRTETLSDYGKNKKYYITTDDDYTHVIILNTAMPYIKDKIPRKNVIGFACEPPQFLGLTHQFILYAMENIHKYYIGDATTLPYPFIQGNAYLWYNPPPKSIPLKNKLMSIIFSYKTTAPGHAYRHVLVREILQRHLPIDIYGNGCDMYNIIDPRIKGKFKLNEPYDEYKFHITIENFRTNEYFSEKISNPLMRGCIPIYLGATNIDKYFKNMYIPLVGDITQDIDIIQNIISNQEEFLEKHAPDITRAENVMNLFKNKNIERAFGINTPVDRRILLRPKPRPEPFIQQMSKNACRI